MEIPQRISTTDTASTFPLPPEILHQIIVFHLTEVFYTLIVEPGLGKARHSLSSLLHTSSQFRTVTMHILNPILGEPALADNPRESIKYQAVLYELEHLHEFTRTSDPRAVLEPHPGVLAAIAPREECTSLILWHARDLAVRRLHLCLIEEHSSSVGDVDSAKLQELRLSLTRKLVSSMEGVPHSILASVFKPINEYRISMELLSQRVILLRGVCAQVRVIMPFLWKVPDEVIHMHEASFDAAFDRYREAARHTAQLVRTARLVGWAVAQLHVPRATLEAIRFYRAFRALEDAWPAGRAEDSWLMLFARRTRELMLSSLPGGQKEEFLKCWEDARGSFFPDGENSDGEEDGEGSSSGDEGDDSGTDTGNTNMEDDAF